MNNVERQHFYQQAWFIESNWVSVSTKWFLTLSGKLARIVLIIATLYMSAELYPGVKFPDALNLAVFVIMSFALDMGGLGLAQIAKTARDTGNIVGAERGEKLSKWLIGIMIAGLVTVSVEHIASTIEALKVYQNYLDAGQLLVDAGLTIARAVCAVQYGHVLHDLEQTIERVQPVAQPVQNNPAPPAIDYGKLAEKVQVNVAQPDPVQKVDISGIAATAQPVLVDSYRQFVVMNQTTDLSVADDGGDDDICQQDEGGLLDSGDDIYASYPDDMLVDTGERETVKPDTTPKQRITVKLVDSLEGKSNRRERNTDKLSGATQRQATQRKQVSGGDAEKRIRRLLKKTPDMKPSAIATKANVSRQYASQIKAKIDAELV